MEISKEQLAALLQQAFVAGFQYSEEGINGEVCSGREREKMLAEATEYAAKDIAQAAWGKIYEKNCHDHQQGFSKRSRQIRAAAAGLVRVGHLSCRA